MRNRSRNGIENVFSFFRNNKLASLNAICIAFDLRHRNRTESPAHFSFTLQAFAHCSLQAFAHCCWIDRKTDKSTRDPNQKRTKIKTFYCLICHQSIHCDTATPTIANTHIRSPVLSITSLNFRLVSITLFLSPALLNTFTVCLCVWCTVSTFGSCFVLRIN